MRRSNTVYCLALALTALVLLTSCTRRQLVPGLIAGTGAILTTSGAIYRVSIDSDEPLGDTSGEVATTSVLIFGGLGLLLTGVIWSLTSTHCDENADCWSDDVCEMRSHTCIDGAAARRMTHLRPRSQDTADEQGDGADEEEGTGEDQDEEEGTGEDGDPDEGAEEEAETTPDE
jgi:hypothetical protein